MGSITVTFNEVDLGTTYSCKFFRTDTDTSPAREMTKISIPSRSGNLLIDGHKYPNVENEYTAVFYGADADSNAVALKNFLLSQVGYKRLTDSEHLEEYYMARISKNIEPVISEERGQVKMELIFDRKPQRFLTSGQTKYTWVPGGPQELSGSSLDVYGPQLDSSVFTWSYEAHGVTVGSSSGPGGAGRTNYNIKKASSLNVYLNNRLAASYTLSDVTKATANLVTGFLTVYSSVIATPTTGWELYSSNVFRVSVSGWSGINAARRLAWTIGSVPQAYEYPVFSDLTDLTNNAGNYGCCLDGGYLYVKDTQYSTADAFMSGKGGFLIDRTLSTAQTQSITAFDMSEFEIGFVNVKGSNGQAETFSMEYEPSDSLSNPTEFPSEPHIRAYGNGSFTMDGVTITITGATSYTDIDCEMMDCYEGSTNRNDDVTFSTYDFPKLRSGDNNVTIVSGISALEITPRWWRL